MIDPDLSPLGPLADVIALTVRTSRVRLGVPEDLVAPLTVAVAAYMGKQLGPDPAELGRIAAQFADDAVAPVDGYEHRDTLGVLLSRMRRGVLLEGERRLLAERVEQLLGERDQMAARVATLEHVAIGNRRHVQTLVPELEQAQAAVERVRDECDAIDRDVSGKSPVALAGLRTASYRMRAALEGRPAETPKDVTP